MELLGAVVCLAEREKSFLEEKSSQNLSKRSEGTEERESGHGIRAWNPGVDRIYEVPCSFIGDHQLLRRNLNQCI